MEKCDCLKSFRGVGGFGKIPPCDDAACTYAELKDTNFIRIGSAKSAPTPQHAMIIAGEGIGINKPIELTIDKEWIKRLLWEFLQKVNGEYNEKEFIQEFLEDSEIWNGK